MPVNVLIQFRRDTAASWAGANPTLADGEPGWENDTGKVKIGDGTTAWNSLPYIAPPAISAWGEASTAQFSGSGSPVGVVTPSGAGDLYVDNTTPALWQATGATDTDWVLLSSAATSREILSGNTLTIPNTSSDNLTWDTQDSGDPLLDLTDPRNPVVIAEGVYAVSVTAQPTAPMTVGGGLELVLYLDSSSPTGGYVIDTATASPGNVQPRAGASLTYFVAAGGVLNAVVSNYDGVNDLDYQILTAVVQKIS